MPRKYLIWKHRHKAWSFHILPLMNWILFFYRKISLSFIRAFFIDNAQYTSEFLENTQSFLFSLFLFDSSFVLISFNWEICNFRKVSLWKFTFLFWLCFNLILEFLEILSHSYFLYFYLIQALSWYHLIEKSVTLGRSVCQNLHSFLVVFQPNSCMVTELLTWEQNVNFLEMKFLLGCLTFSSFYTLLLFLLLHQVKNWEIMFISRGRNTGIHHH